MRPADTAMSAATASAPVTPSWNAIQEKERLQRSLRPKYLRHNIYHTDTFSLSTADWTEYALPLPSPPKNETDNPIVSKTITENPSLFKIITPINVNRFESLLSDHLNQPFVSSVCRGLREGFWPWADTLKDGYPITHDASLPTSTDPAKALFLRQQRDIELQKGRFSPSFGRDLLPGMYSMPIHAVPKPGSSDLRMVTDQSAGRFSLNSMIARDDIKGYPLDNMKHLGEELLLFRRTHGDEPLMLFKSDVAEAYRLLLVHPFWQIKQVNTFDGKRYVDRCNPFGGRGSGCLWISVNGLVTWIARYVRNIPTLLVYSDNAFSIV